MQQSSPSAINPRSSVQRDAVLLNRATLFLADVDGCASALDASPDGEARSCAAIEHILRLRDPDFVARLRAAIKAAINERRREVLLCRDDSPTGSLVLVRPAREPDRAIVRLEPLEAGPPQLNIATLIDLFGIAPSEAEIAVALASDRSVVEIAGARSVRVETVRGQIKSLLRKMELNSQKQLVRVLTLVAAALG
jgi:DNA-binding CsgD family transcriptional regulator